MSYQWLLEFPTSLKLDFLLKAIMTKQDMEKWLFTFAKYVSLPSKFLAKILLGWAPQTQFQPAQPSKDWLEEAQLSNLSFTQICFAQKRLEFFNFEKNNGD